MSGGGATDPNSQDRLSQWRAYGQDGRGVCISFSASQFANLVYHTPGLRINPVIYDPAIQRDFIRAVVAEGDKLHANSDPNAVAATLASLNMPISTQQILELLRMSPDGLTAGEVCEKLNALQYNAGGRLSKMAAW